MFGKSYRLPFTLLGIPLLLDVSFLIVLPLMAWVIGRSVPQLARMFDLADPDGDLVRGWMPYLLGLAAAVGLFVGVVVHELGHAVTGRMYGVRTKSITLWILGGVAAFDEIPRKRWAEAVVAIAGPITSVVVASVCWGLRAFFPTSTVGVHFVLSYLAVMNLFLAVFNLIPALPMDGGRVLRSLLATRMSYARATAIAAGVSRVIAVLMGIWGVLTGSFILLLVAFFVYIAGSSEQTATAIEEILKGLPVRQLMTEDVKTVPPEMPLDELTRIMLREHHLGFPVVDPATGRVVGLVTLQDLQQRAAATGTDAAAVAAPPAAVADVMSREVESIPVTADASEAFRQMSAADFRRLVVMDGDRLAGILTKTDLMHAIKVRAVQPDAAPHAPWGRYALQG